MHQDDIHKNNSNDFFFNFPPEARKRMPGKLPPLKTTLYRLVTGYDSKKFNVEVSGYLSEGWALHGSPTIATCGTTGNVIYGQALTREVEVTEN